LKLISILVLATFLSCNGSKKNTELLSWSNPIQKGLNPYGMKDFFVFYEDSTYFLVGTEYKNPFEGYLGPNLYTSTNLNSWQRKKKLVNVLEIPTDAWYKDGWFAPEIKKIKDKYYYTFNNRNNAENPYQKTGFGIASSSSLSEDFKVLNTAKPLVLGNHGSLTVGENEDEIFLTYDMDGRIYIAEIDLDTATLITQPEELLGPKTLGENYRFLDAPQITKVENTYHMLFSQFYGGYVVKIFHITATHPRGPWTWDENNPMYTFLEAEADMDVKNNYPEKHGYAPPTQVIFSNQLFLGEFGHYFNAYHSSEKYSEPYLCIEPVEIEDKTLKTINPKQINQTVKLK
jgi:hypothetical protein